jgi:hypothetical protein
VGSVFLVSHDHGAHWNKRVNDEPSSLVAPVPAWTDHTRWPANFTVWFLAVDPHRPATIYAAGGFAFGRGGRGPVHLLLRSTDGGRTWADLLVWHVDLHARTPLVTNIAVTPANRQDLTYRRVHNAQTLVIDPRDPRRLYLGTDELGVLRSTDGGRTWHYNSSSPNVAHHVSEHLVINPQNRSVLYLLVQDTTASILYRSADSGTTWHVAWHGGFASSLSLEGRMLYLARDDGIYASADGGVHWRRVENGHSLPPLATKSFAQAGAILEAWHDQPAGAWDVVADNPMVAGVAGLYSTRDGGTTWRRLSDGLRGAQKTPALALGDMAEGYTRLWPDRRAHPAMLFTSGDQDGLYRWSLGP